MYFPQYQILRKEDMLPRDEIRLIAENQLEDLMAAELKNLRRGIPHKLVITDTPQNREAVDYRVAYFQIVAYKEGWKFDPQNYQVRFVSSSDPRIREVTDPNATMIRTYTFGNEEGREETLGFESVNEQRTFRRISNGAARIVSERVHHLFKKKK